MTTNVTDLVAKQMASDSRWSIRVEGSNFGPAIMFTDSARFEKIVLDSRGIAFIFAGRGQLIQFWKDWLSTKPTGSAGRPGHVGISVCMVRSATMKADALGKKLLMVTDGMNPRAIFAGSGAVYATISWHGSPNAHSAVKMAIERDFCSGGVIKYAKLETWENNLDDTESIKQVTEHIAEEGYVMYENGQIAGPVSVKQAVIIDAAVKQTLEKVADGRLVADAPFDAMDEPWAEADVRRLDTALDEAFAS